jgi:hypothetical protein
MSGEDKVRQAVQQALEELGVELEDFQLVLFPEQVESSFGGWLVPAEIRPSKTGRKSYELHRLIEKLEDRLHDLTESTVTIDLKPAA